MTTSPQFIESLRRLYDNGRIAIFKLDKMKKDGAITEEDYQYIVSKKESR